MRLLRADVPHARFHGYAASADRRRPGSGAAGGFGFARGASRPLRARFLDYSIDSCAACGLCETVCPIGINTGSMSKAMRERHRSAFARGVAGFAGRHYGAALGLVRTGLRAASAFDAVTAGYGLDAAGAFMRGALGDSAPLVSHRATPRAGTRIGPKPVRAAGKPRAIYFASCAGQMFGPGRSDGQGEPLSVTLYRLAQKAGIELVTPKGAAHLCCGQPFDSKGLSREADRKAEEAAGALVEASAGGRWPVFSDTSPCSQRLKAAGAARLPSSRHR